MKYKKQLWIAVFLLSLFSINIFCGNISNGILNRSYKPYKGVVVVLDAGHGGKDDGARYASLKEQELNLSITKLIKKELEELGMKVVLTRNGKDDLATSNIKNRKREDMKARVKIINREEVDFFISIHMNAFPTSKPSGSQIFYAKQDEDSYVFANYIQKEITKLTSSKQDPKVGDYYILNESYKVGILLECGFLSNPQDREKLADTKYQKQLSNCIKKGIMLFLEEVYE